MVIYKITNIITGMCYIGQTKQKVEVRWYRHLYEALKKKSEGYLYNAIRKYGKENFFIKVIDGANCQSELNYKEFLLIHKENTLFPNGYNLKAGGNAGTMHIETRKKLSKSIKAIFTKERQIYLTNLSKQYSCCKIIAIDSKLGISIELDSLADTKKLGLNPKYVGDILGGRKTYKIYNNYFLFFKDKPTKIKYPKSKLKIKPKYFFEEKQVHYYSYIDNSKELYYEGRACDLLKKIDIRHIERSIIKNKKAYGKYWIKKIYNIEKEHWIGKQYKKRKCKAQAPAVPGPQGPVEQPNTPQQLFAQNQ